MLACDPILVLGAPRSGTTYLREIIDRHPEVAMTNEFRVFEWLHGSLELCDDDRSMLLGREQFVAHLREELPEMIRSWYRKSAPDARWWGDKNPHYAAKRETLETIVSLFPRARFIHIVRDPRAVVSSLLSKRHADGRAWTTLEDAHGIVATHQHNGAAFIEDLGPDLGHELRYEDLVGDDLGVARDLFQWLDIPFAPEVESFCRAQRVARTPICGPTSELSRAGSRDSAQEAWAKAIPAESKRRSLEHLAPYLLHFGYETEESLEELRGELPPAP